MEIIPSLAKLGLGATLGYAFGIFIHIMLQVNGIEYDGDTIINGCAALGGSFQITLIASSQFERKRKEFLKKVFHIALDVKNGIMSPKKASELIDKLQEELYLSKGLKLDTKKIEDTVKKIMESNK